MKKYAWSEDSEEDNSTKSEAKTGGGEQSPAVKRRGILKALARDDRDYDPLDTDEDKPWDIEVDYNDISDELEE